MKNKLRPIEKKVLIVYAALLAILLICAVYLSLVVELYEVTNWNGTIFTKSLIIILPFSILVSLLFTNKIVAPLHSKMPSKNRRKGLVIGFVIATFINFFLMLATVHLVAKLYNIYGPDQKQILVTGEIIEVYNKRKYRKRTKKKNNITIQSNTLHRIVKFEARKKYEKNQFFEEQMTLGSLGFLYKKFD
jgi:amino acid transporter